MKAHGGLGAAARAAPLLGDVLTAYDLGKELADDIVQEALEEEKQNLEQINAKVLHARDQATAAMSGALNRLGQVVRVRNMYVGEDILSERISSDLQSYWNQAETAYVLFQNGDIDETKLQQMLKDAESNLENSLRITTDDPLPLPGT